MEDRYTEIERENRILLEKITGIMKQNPKSNYKAKKNNLSMIKNKNNNY